MYLLDTNACIALINASNRNVEARYAAESRRKQAFKTSSMVVHELWFGVAKSSRVVQNAHLLAAFLGRNFERA